MFLLPLDISHSFVSPLRPPGLVEETLIIPESEPHTEKAPGEEAHKLESPSESIQDDILITVRAVMGAFARKGPVYQVLALRATFQ